jgi:hypothetical protein
MFAQMTRGMAAAACGLVLAACGPQEAPPAAPTETPAAGPAPAVELTREELDARRIADLVAINNALRAYHAQNGAYPISPRQGFTGVIEGGANWIPELVPAHIAALPRDPAMSSDADRQYRYASDGVDYKLIAHGVSGQCGPEIQRDGVRMDPARTRDGRCWAYGFWTEGRRNW